MKSVPTITSQLSVCPIPFKLDTYSSCPFGCIYCFAKSIVSFNRKLHNRDLRLDSIDISHFENWVRRSFDKPFDYKHPNLVAFKERIPLKIGGNCDPFPPIEKKLGVTKKILQILHEYDYPVQILTKNLKLVEEIYDYFDDPNWAISVSLISIDQLFLKKLEKNTPTPKERLTAIEKLSKRGVKVLVKIQPAFYPRILSDLPGLIQSIKDAGAYAYNIEGLKFKSSDTFQKELGLKYYKRVSVIDYELPYWRKKEYWDLAKELAKVHKLKFFIADNNVMNLTQYCTSSECCGTERLRNYKIWGGNEKTIKLNKDPSYLSTELQKCNVGTNNYTNKAFMKVMKHNRKKKKLGVL